MKTIKLFLSVLLVAGMFATVLNGCGEDEKPALALTAITAGGIDLNGATSAVGVPVGASIVATFNVAVDQASTSAITLTRQYDGVVVPTTITVSGAEVTIDPNDDFGTGTLFLLNFDKSLSSTDGQGMANNTERNFTTEGTFAVAGAFAQWTFEDNANDVIGSFDPPAAQIIGVTYVAGRKADAGKAASFNGTTSIIEIPNGDQLMNNGDWTLSVWVKATPHTDNPDKGHFVLGLGAFNGFQFEIFDGYTAFKLAASYTNGTANFGEDIWADGSGNLGWQGWTFSKDFGTATMSPAIKNVWANYVFVYNAATKVGTAYLNGEKVKEQDFDLWPDGDPKRSTTGLNYRGVAPEVVNELALGFIHSRAGTLWDNESWGGYSVVDPVTGIPSAKHFKGEMDDLIIYKKALTSGEIATMYNSGK